MKNALLASPPDAGEEVFSHVAGRLRLASALFCAALLLALAFPVILSAQTNCTPPPPGLVSWWRAEDNALDWTGGNNGTIEGGVTYSPGKVGEAFVLNGNDCGVEVGSPGNLQLQNFTLEAWIQRATNTVATSDGSGAGCFFSTHLGWYVGIYNDGIAVLYDTESGNEVDSPVGLTDTAWHHIAVTKNGTNVVFYIDGNGYTSAPFNDTFVFSGEAAIGGYSSDGVYYETFYGSIDELSIYDQALPASEIQAIYNAGSAGKCAMSESVPSIVSQPTNQTIIAGDSVSFSVTATSFGPEVYQWSYDRTNIDGATNSELALANVQFDQAGSYAVTVANAYGRTISSNAVLTVEPSPPCVTAPSGLVSWWRGERNAIDRVSGNNAVAVVNVNLPPISSVEYGAGKVGEGFAIDGYGIRLESTNNLQLQTFTIDCWMRLADASLSTGDGSGSGYYFAFGEGGYGFGIHDGGALFLAGVGTDEIDSSVEISDTNFHHVAVTESGGNVEFYVDGVGYMAGAFNTNFTFTTPAAIGARGDSIENTFLGIVDELSIYNRALSAAEIGSIYGVRSSGKCVAAVPVIAAQPASQAVTAYSPVSFTVLADGPISLQYQWMFDGTNLAGATNSTLSFDPVLPAQAGTYSVIVGTKPNLTNTSNAVLTVALPPPPAILTQPASHIGVVDDYTTFGVLAQSQAPVPMFYQWTWDGTNLAGATNNELVISNLTLANAGTYTVQVSNPFFATNSQPAILTMIPAPTGTNRIVANLDPNELSRALEAGGSTTFVCNGTITLPRPVTLSHDVVVDAGNYEMNLSGGGISQILAIPPGVNVTLRNLTLSGGVANQGGGISNSGALTASNVSFLGNTAALFGGAIFNSGTASLTSVSFSNNAAGTGGGAICNSNGTVSLTNVVFSSNAASASGSTDAYGGGLFNQGGTVKLQNVSFNDNVAQGGTDSGYLFQAVAQGYGFGGALYSAGGWVEGNAVECTNNAALSGQGSPGYYEGFSPGKPGAGIGGAFCLTNCKVVLSNGWFVINSTSCSATYNEPPVGSEGGAVFNAGWTMLVEVGFISNNCPGVDGINGQLLDDNPDVPEPGGPGEGGAGGAVYNMGLLVITNCTFTANTVIGGNGGPGGTCTDCMPQQTGPVGSPGNALGGALANFGTVTIVSNAFLNNSASGLGTDVGTIYSVCNLQLDTNDTTISPDTVDSVSNASAPFLALEPQSQIVVVGSTVTLTALAVGSPAPTYQWLFDGTNVSGATASALTLTNVRQYQSGTYTVIATNSDGSSKSQPAVVTVEGLILTGIDLGPGGFSISGSGIPGANFVIEVSTNLVNWQPLWTNPSPFTFIDTNASVGKDRYYRAVGGK